MKQETFKILSHTPLTDAVWELRLEGDSSAVTRPGQFVEVALPGRFLRRPISVCDWDSAGMTLVYKTVGEGTRQLSQMAAGETLDILTGLGNGYDCSLTGSKPLLVGGGVGVPPMYGLCKTLLAEGKDVTVILGFNTKSEIFYAERFSALGARVLVTTADGSAGIRGFVTDALAGLDYSHVCACGPLPMLRALDRAASGAGQFSLEERMGCGFGACMGCAIQTKEGAKRVCKDGPVFRREVLIWEN